MEVEACEQDAVFPTIPLFEQLNLWKETSVQEESCKCIEPKSKQWPSFMPYASCASPSLFSDESATDVKRKWRQSQISNHRSLNCAGDYSSWRKGQITFLWCGWLKKQSSGIVSRWQARWFELRQEPVSAGGSKGFRAVLQYKGRGSDGGEEVKRLDIINVRRDRGHDGTGRACLSVKVAGRSGRVLLGAESDREAASLHSCIAFVLHSAPYIGLR